MLRTCLAAFLILAGAPAVAAANCSGHDGQIVYLRSADIDPDVFVWDTQDRVREYSSGYWKTSEVMAHTTLTKPGTRALIVQCHEGAVKSKYVNQVLDAVGIRLMSGPNRGRYGWVTSEDVHAATKTAEIRAK